MGKGDWRDKGRDEGSDGFSKTPLNKGLPSLDGRDEGFLEVSCSYSLSEGSCRAISAFVFSIKGNNYSHLGNKTFPAWE